METANQLEPANQMIRLNESQLRVLRAWFNLTGPDVVGLLRQSLSPDTLDQLRDLARTNAVAEESIDRMAIKELIDAVGRMDNVRTTRIDILVFAMHGFNTRGDWKNSLTFELTNATNGERFICHPWDYGVFRLGILNPIARTSKVNSFQRFYNDIVGRFEGRDVRICAIAHSFGTYILGQALLRFPEVRFDGVILLGCLLPRNYPWRDVRKKCRSVLNQIGGSDFALSVARFVPGLGVAGREGFIDRPEFVFEERYPGSGHSDMFGANLMREKWVDFLRSVR